jgi:Copper binding proteins, plastocyanin/azurin family
MRVAAAALMLLALSAPAADAKPRVRCLVRAHCGKHVRSPAVAPPMVAANPFVTPVVVTPPPAARLGVSAREWSLVLSRTTLAAGPAIVELQNFGEDAHNLRLERVDGTGAALSVPLAESGERKSASGTLAAGTYKVYCALPGHDAQGMHATLEVR